MENQWLLDDKGAQIGWKADDSWLMVDDGSAMVHYEDGLVVLRRVIENQDQVKIRYVGVCEKDGQYSFGDAFSVALDGGKEGAASHVLQLKASLFEWTGEDGSVSGEMRNVKNSPLDFNEDKFIGEALESHHPQIRAKEGIDHVFVLEDEKEALWLYSPRTRISLSVDTDWPELGVSCGLKDREIRLRIGALRPVKMKAGDSFVRELAFTWKEEIEA